MDYIYAKLNYEVKKIKYDGKSTDTASIDINQSNSEISVDVLKVPNALNILDKDTDTLTSFDGSVAHNIALHSYNLLKVSVPAEENLAEYQLMKDGLPVGDKIIISNDLNVDGYLDEGSGINFGAVGVSLGIDENDMLYWPHTLRADSFRSTLWDKSLNIWEACIAIASGDPNVKGVVLGADTVGGESGLTDSDDAYIAVVRPTDRNGKDYIYGAGAIKVADNKVITFDDLDNTGKSLVFSADGGDGGVLGMLSGDNDDVIAGVKYEDNTDNTIYTYGNKGLVIGSDGYTALKSLTPGSSSINLFDDGYMTLQGYVDFYGTDDSHWASITPEGLKGRGYHKLATYDEAKYEYANGIIKVSNPESVYDTGKIEFDLQGGSRFTLRNEGFELAAHSKQLNNKVMGAIVGDDTGVTIIGDSGTTVAEFQVDNITLHAPISILGKTTAQRPSLTSYSKGVMIFDTTLNKPIWWDGTKWIDAMGNDV